MEVGLRQYKSSADLSQCGTIRDHVYQSRWFRGLKPQMEWLRLTLKGNGGMRVRIYVSDGQPENFPDLGTREPVLDRENTDLLLYGVRGKYLCFTVEPGAALKEFRLEFPGHSIDEGLPAVLQGDDTLRALLGVYQSRYMDLNRKAAEFTERLNPQSPDALPELNRWLGSSRWSLDSELEASIRMEAPHLARIRGTGNGLRRLVKLLTGSPCWLIESWLMKQNGGLYREHVNDFHLNSMDKEDITIILPPKISGERISQLKSLLPDFIPLGISYRVVYLSDNSRMDSSSYMDINGVLGGYSIGRLDHREVEDVILQ